MAEESKACPLGKKSILEDVWKVNEIKVALLAGFTPDQDTLYSFTDIAQHEITDPNYTPGGYVLDGCDVAYDPLTNEIHAIALVETLPAILSFDMIAVYDNTHASKRILRYMKFTGMVTTDKLNWENGVVLQETAL